MRENPLGNNPQPPPLAREVTLLLKIHPKIPIYASSLHNVVLPTFTFIHFNFTDGTLILVYGAKSLYSWLCEHQPMLCKLLVG